MADEPITEEKPIEAEEEQKPAAEEQKPEEQKPEEKPAEEKPAEEKPAAPESYDLKLPEGSLLDQAHIDEIAKIAKERGLSNEEAQGLLDRDNKLLGSYAEGQQKAFETETGKWLDQAKNDDEIGGGSEEAFGKNAELAKRVVDRFGTKELKDGLNATRFGNHPELVRMLVRIGKAMSEDQLVLPGAKNSAEEKTMADVFYGGDNQEKKE